MFLCTGLLLRLEIGVLDAGCEAGALLGYAGELSVANDASLGIVATQLLQQRIESVLL